MIFVVGGEGEGGSAERARGGGEPAADGEGGVAEERRAEGEEKGGRVVTGRQELVVFPLLSWYHASWDNEPNLPPGEGGGCGA